MFKRRGAPEPDEPARSDRYAVHALALNPRAGEVAAARALKDALNEGDAEGWELVNVYSVGGTTQMIVWDKAPR